MRESYWQKTKKAASTTAKAATVGALGLHALYHIAPALYVVKSANNSSTVQNFAPHLEQHIHQHAGQTNALGTVGEFLHQPAVGMTLGALLLLYMGIEAYKTNKKNKQISHLQEENKRLSRQLSNLEIQAITHECPKNTVQVANNLQKSSLEERTYQ